MRLHHLMTSIHANMKEAIKYGLINESHMHISNTRPVAKFCLYLLLSRLPQLRQVLVSCIVFIRLRI